MSWIGRNGFILGLVLAVVVAFVWPGPGAQGGALHADVTNNFGIATLFLWVSRGASPMLQAAEA